MEEFDRFLTITILKVIDKHAPLTSTTRKQKRLLQKPWITKEIYNGIRQKQRMYNTHFKSGDPMKIALYKKFVNKLNHKKELSKKNTTNSPIQQKADSFYKSSHQTK